MFDNLREESSKSAYDEPKSAQLQLASGASTSAAPRRRVAKFMGMTAPERLVIAFMVMVAVLVIGVMCLLITGKLAI